MVHGSPALIAGANNMGYGTVGTAGRLNMGALPPGGQWVKLEVSARALGPEGRGVKGMCFSLYVGKVT